MVLFPSGHPCGGVVRAHSTILIQNSKPYSSWRPVGSRVRNGSRSFLKASHVRKGPSKVLSLGQKPWWVAHGLTVPGPAVITFFLSPQLCANLPVRTGAPAADPSSVSAALASVGHAVRRSSLRRNLTPRMRGRCQDAQWRGHPALTGAARPEEAL